LRLKGGEAEILDFIGEIPFQQLDVKNLETRKQKKMDEIEKCKRPKSSLYEDMKDGILTKEEYLELHEAYLKKEKEGEEKNGSLLRLQG
jgi:hypothetical protein